VKPDVETWHVAGRKGKRHSLHVMLSQGVKVGYTGYTNISYGFESHIIIIPRSNYLFTIFLDKPKWDKMAKALAFAERLEPVGI